jgi:hypothetical protein
MKTRMSQLTRNSIDLLKEYYRADLSTKEWQLVVSLKKALWHGDRV